MQCRDMLSTLPHLMPLTKAIPSLYCVSFLSKKKRSLPSNFVSACVKRCAFQGQHGIPLLRQRTVLQFWKCLVAYIRAFLLDMAGSGKVVCGWTMDTGHVAGCPKVSYVFVTVDLSVQTGGHLRPGCPCLTQISPDSQGLSGAEGDLNLLLDELDTRCLWGHRT